MKPHTFLLSISFAIFITLSLLTPLPSIAKDAEGDSSSGGGGGSGGTGGSAGDENKQIVSSPSSLSYAQAMDDIVREIMNEFSHMTSLHESLNFVPHPLFARPRFGLWSGGDVGDEHISSTASESKSSSVSSSDNKISPLSPWGTSWGTFPGSRLTQLTRWSPRYQVIDDAKNFQVSLDVPGFHFHEMNVELESGGRVLSIVGTKEETTSTSSTPDEDKTEDKMGGKIEDKAEDEVHEKVEFSSHTHSSTSFQQKFTLDPSVDVTKMTANLVDGVLVVRAPRKKYENVWGKRHIPITQFDREVWEELMGGDDEDDLDAEEK